MTVNKISVIITCYNSEKIIERTLACVFAQTRLPDEIIIVDDGSTDKTKEIVSKYNVVYHYQENQGIATSLNTGVKLSTGNILAFLDHDDLWTPDKLQLQLDILEQNPAIDLVFSLIENKVVNEELTDLDVVCEPMVGIHKSAFMVKQETFMRIGLFSTDSGSQEFLDWFALAIDNGLKYHVIQKVLVYRTIHGTNNSIVKKETRNDFPRVLRMIMERRRSKE